MVAEFKKEAVLKEINRLSAEVEESKRIIEEAEERQQQEDEVMSRLGITVQQVRVPWAPPSLSTYPTQAFVRRTYTPITCYVCLCPDNA